MNGGGGGGGGDAGGGGGTEKCRERATELSERIVASTLTVCGKQNRRKHAATIC